MILNKESMKKKYIKPEYVLIKPEDFETIMNNSRLSEDDKHQDNHECCSLCNEHWHCDHPVDSWSGEAFNECCDYYE